MPVQYFIYPQYRLVVTTGRGRVVFAEVRAHQDALLDDPDFHPEFNQLMEGTDVTDFALSADEIRVLTTRKVFSPMSRRALIVGNTFLYGMGRMLQTYHELSETAPLTIFRDRASALQWLSVPQDFSSTPFPENLGR